MRSHPGRTSAVFGLVFALMMLVAGGTSALDPVGVTLAAVLGFAFGAAMYAVARMTVR